MRRFLTIISFLILCIPAGKGSGKEPPFIGVEHHFGFNLMPSTINPYCHYAIVKTHEGKIIDIDHVPKKKFILQVKGKIRCKANPEGEDLMEKNNIKSCKVSYDSYGREYKVKCSPLDDIWKLRFGKNPVPSKDGSAQGWAGKKYNPTEGQRKILSRYGIKDLKDFAYGENFFLLLRKMQNSTWVSRYQSS